MIKLTNLKFFLYVCDVCFLYFKSFSSLVSLFIVSVMMFISDLGTDEMRPSAAGTTLCEMLLSCDMNIFPFLLLEGLDIQYIQIYLIFLANDKLFFFLESA